jgi:oligoribonuclease NrnB/cAMP/cGMP phosphodiesterase (DHH superfamily)
MSEHEKFITRDRTKIFLDEDNSSRQEEKLFGKKIRKMKNFHSNFSQREKFSTIDIDLNER